MGHSGGVWRPAAEITSLRSRPLKGWTDGHCLPVYLLPLTLWCLLCVLSNFWTLLLPFSLLLLLRSLSSCFITYLKQSADTYAVPCSDLQYSYCILVSPFALSLWQCRLASQSSDIITLCLPSTYSYHHHLAASQLRDPCIHPTFHNGRHLDNSTASHYTRFQMVSQWSYSTTQWLCKVMYQAQRTLYKEQDKTLQEAEQCWILLSTTKSGDHSCVLHHC